MDDPLNGFIVFALGAVILFLTIINNFKMSDKSLAVKGTIAQIIIYIPYAIIWIFIVFVMLSYFSGTRPTYNINSRD